MNAYGIEWIAYIAVATIWVVGATARLGYEYQDAKDTVDPISVNDAFGIVLCLGVVGGLLWPLLLAVAVLSSPFWIGRGIALAKQRKLDRATEANR